MPLTFARVADIRNINNSMERIRWCDSRYTDTEPTFRGNLFIKSPLGTDTAKRQWFMTFYTFTWRTIWGVTDRFYDLRVSYEISDEDEVKQGGDLVIPFSPQFFGPQENVCNIQDIPDIIKPGGVYPMALTQQEADLLQSFWDGTYNP